MRKLLAIAIVLPLLALSACGKKDEKKAGDTQAAKPAATSSATIA